jgi:periplasmic divalent cation tolerance protein
MSQQSDHDPVYVLYCTISPNEAQTIAATLVEEKLVACVNIIPQLTSIYWWENKVCSESESLLMMKTPQRLVPRVMQRIPEIHPYDVPEILAYPIEHAHPPYATWVHDVTK